MTYESTMTLTEAASLLTQTSGRVVVLTHAKPDGDAFGAVVALTATLKSLGHDVEACFVAPIPASLADFRGSELVQVYDPATTDFLPASLREAGLYVVLDTGAWSQVGPMRQIIEPNVQQCLIVDHHLSGDIPAAYRYIDGQAAACCEVVAELIDLLYACQPRASTARRVGDKPRLPIHASEQQARIIRDALFIGIASDTGWFRFSNTRPGTHELAANLLRGGVDHAEIYRQIEQNERVEKLSLTIRALDSLKLLANGRAAIMVLKARDFAETGALEEETERLIDIPQQVGSVQVIALVSEKQMRGNGDVRMVTRVSFRSKPGPDAVNVATLAAQFGGGGHARAAGATVEAPLDDVLPRLEQALAGL